MLLENFSSDFFSATSVKNDSHTKFTAGDPAGRQSDKWTPEPTIRTCIFPLSKNGRVFRTDSLEGETVFFSAKAG